MSSLLRPPLLSVLLGVFFGALLGVLLAAPGALLGPKAGARAGDAPDNNMLVIETAGGLRAFTVELAVTPAERRRGLMGRKSLPANHGMLFDFRAAPGFAMWMKDTPLALDMLFLDRRGRVLGAAENTVPFSAEIIPAPEGAAAVFEVQGGTAARLGIAAGDRVRHPLFQTENGAGGDVRPVSGYAAGLSRGAGHARTASHPPGVNGLYDMAANVWEWTEDGGRAQKRTRGGSWWYGAGRMRAGDKALKPRTMAAVYIGFRCAKDAE